MVKHSILGDTFEQLVELGKSTVKSTTQAVTGTPKKTQKKSSNEAVKTNEQAAANLDPEAAKRIETGQHTPLDMKRLEDQYKNQDQEDINEVRKKLEFFQKFRAEEKRAIQERKRQEEERLQRIKMELEEKDKQQKASDLKPVETPKGKERKSILSPKKAVKRSMVETRVGSGKQ